MLPAVFDQKEITRCLYWLYERYQARCRRVYALYNRPDLGRSLRSRLSHAHAALACYTAVIELLANECEQGDMPPGRRWGAAMAFPQAEVERRARQRLAVCYSPDPCKKGKDRAHQIAGYCLLTRLLRRLLAEMRQAGQLLCRSRREGTSWHF